VYLDKTPVEIAQETTKLFLSKTTRNIVHVAANIKKEIDIKTL
jgi:hypothetical protein